MVYQHQNRAEQKKLEIIRAAHDLFVKQGYHGTSMRQIARQSGIALGGLYNHFDSKEQVFIQVFLDYHPYQEVIPALLSAEGNTVEGFLSDAMQRMLAAFDRRPDFMNLMFIEVVEFNSQHVNKLAAQLIPYQLKIVDRMLELDQGSLKPIPPLMLARTFLGLFFSYKIIDLMLSDGAPAEFFENALEYSLDIYLHGILKEG